MHLGGVTGTTGQSRLVNRGVAAVAVLIGHGVANLAGKVTEVLLVLGIAGGISPDILMAIFALHHGRVLIPGSCGLARTVELLAVAGDTSHGLLCPVDISWNALIFPEVLGADTGAVAGDTVIFHGWSLAELVPGNKSAAHLIRPADVALPARSVALLAVVFKGCGQWGTLFQVTTPGFKNGFKTAERCMETNLVSVGDVHVTGIAVTLGRVDYQPHVGYFLFLYTAVTTMTDDAANLTVGTLDKLGILQEDLLPYLQRR